MPPPSEPRIGRLLSEAYTLWQKETYALLADRGFPEIRPAHSPVFRYLEPNGSRTVDLAQRASMTKQSMGYLVSSLETAGFVELVSDPADARARLVRLTQKGQRADNTLAESSRKLEGRLGAKIGTQELAALRAALVDLLDCDFSDG